LENESFTRQSLVSKESEILKQQRQTFCTNPLREDALTKNFCSLVFLSNGQEGSRSFRFSWDDRLSVFLGLLNLLPWSPSAMTRSFSISLLDVHVILFPFDSDEKQKKRHVRVHKMESDIIPLAKNDSLQLVD
jgi:hypothetical protein